MATREYGKNLFSTWTDEHFICQPTFDKLLYQVLIGQPPTLLNHAGVQPFSMRRWRKAMRDGDTMPSEDDILAAFDRMEALRYVYADEDTCEVLVRSFMRRDGVDKQPTVMLAALRSTALVESAKLAAILLDELENRISLPAVTGGTDYSERLRKSLEQAASVALTHLRSLAGPSGGPSPGGSIGPSPGGSMGGSSRPAETGGSRGGSTGGSRGPSVVVEVEVDTHLGNHLGGEGRPHCSRHPDGNPTDAPCPGCKRAREWDEKHAEDDALAAKRQAKALRVNCPDCHGTNTIDIEGRNAAIKCSHPNSVVMRHA